jgi:predicted DNA-binding transcriptional regulator AlpA
MDRSEHLNPTAEAPVNPAGLSAVLAELARLLPKLTKALERQTAPHVDRLAYRLDELEIRIGVSRRLIQKEIAAGRFPRPIKVGRASVFPVESIRAYLAGERGGRRP